MHLPIQSVTLYRGVNSTNVNFHEATNGIVMPNLKWWQFWRRSATAYEQNVIQGATLWSKYTSWTTDLEVAENFALRTSGKGVIIKVEVPFTETVPSPNLKQVVLVRNGKLVSESEVLLRGKVKGKVTMVP